MSTYNVQSNANTVINVRNKYGVNKKIEIIALADKIVIGKGSVPRPAVVPLTITEFTKTNDYFYQLTVSGLIDDNEFRVGEILEFVTVSGKVYFTVVSTFKAGNNGGCSLKKNGNIAVNVSEILAGTLSLATDNYVEFGTSVNNTVLNTSDVEYLYLVATTGPTADNLVIREFPF